MDDVTRHCIVWRVWHVVSGSTTIIFSFSVMFTSYSSCHFWPMPFLFYQPMCIPSMSLQHGCIVFGCDPSLQCGISSVARSGMCFATVLIHVNTVMTFNRLSLRIANLFNCQDIEQLLLGTIIFIVLCFLFPTILVYYVYFTVVRLFLLFIDTSLQVSLIASPFVTFLIDVIFFCLSGLDRGLKPLPSPLHLPPRV